MTTDNLLREFPPVSTELWEESITRDLKGTDYARKLIWQTAEGLAVKPYYRAEDIPGLDPIDAAPGRFPLLHGARGSGNWLIREEVAEADPQQANRLAQSAVAAGAEEIAFTGIHIRDASELKSLFIGLEAVPVHFQNAGESFLRFLIDILTELKDFAPISTGWDPLANPEFAAEIVRTAPPSLTPFTIDGSKFEVGGATAVDEVGIALAAAIDFLSEMQSHDVPVDEAAKSIAFSFAIGPNYFFQIAKLRALRMLWARVVESFGGMAESARARIHARTSRWNKTIYDSHVNVLRATTEAMSAVLGGADSVTVAPFDECYKSSDEASRRLARNTQIILKQEALLGHVTDPGAGSYCLEVITDFIAQAGWKSMQRIEAQGGYRKAMADGQLSKSLEEGLAEKIKAVTLRRRVFTGTNQFANSSEKALDRIDPAYYMAGRRGAQDYESLRLRTERHAALTGITPRILLAEFGDVKMRSARSGFASNFFACAGFEIIPQRVKSADEIEVVNADLIVLCSSDPEYLGMATQLALKLKSLGRDTSIVVAGNPGSVEELRAAGVTDFIHINSNPIEVLANWQQRLGIKV